ncbi:hydrogenase maturation nickel metallochaperone HypA [bacterium]|nr:hydrogenase maturation nickel metallochaperone HypA [bacterium]
MHELPVTENILKIALDHAKEVHATKITNIYLVIGQLSSIVDDSIQFYWDFLAKDTIANGATLHFRRLPIKLQCIECGTNYEPNNKELNCPECNSQKFLVIQGEEFFLEAIDIDKPDPN